MAEMTKKTLVDYISEEDYPRYQELLEKAQEAKANAPKKPRTPRAKTLDEQIAAAEKKQAEYAAKLEALLAQKGLN